MKNNKRFHQLAKRLDEELEKLTDIFIKEMDKHERTDEEIEEKITNEETISKIIKEIKALS
ncbi:MAG TPA: hypothetical protein VF941_03080 [Clostridia bacterium]